MDKKKPKQLKKKLGLLELNALVDTHLYSKVFEENDSGEKTIEPWLKELRFQQALWVARQILNSEIDENEFNQCWKRTKTIEPDDSSSDSVESNTATFGGYRHRRRSALNKDKANSNPKKKTKRW